MSARPRKGQPAERSCERTTNAKAFFGFGREPRAWRALAWLHHQHLHRAAERVASRRFSLNQDQAAVGRGGVTAREVAVKIGLSADATRMVLDQYEAHAKLLHEAHLILRNLIGQPPGAA
jgi:hypothetical protein